MNTFNFLITYNNLLTFIIILFCLLIGYGNYTESKKILNVYKSVTINYKSWILMFILLFILSYKNISKGILNGIVLFIIAYYSHLFTHQDTSFSAVHLYHHSNNNTFSHYIQIVLEFFSFLVILPTCYFFNIDFFDKWLVIFYYIFYTTVHNVNYSIFHVNNVHEIHHKNTLKNLGPDICDIIFNTKNDDTIENTDHYIYNIIFSFLIVIILKNIWNYSDNIKTQMTNIFGILFYISSLILIYYTFYFKWCVSETVCK